MRLNWSGLAVLVGLQAVSLSASDYLDGQTYFGRGGYVEYRAGDLPLVITTGHGGDRSPAEIPDRTAGVFAIDVNSLELAVACYDELVARSGGHHPHLIVCHLKRRKLDVNRPLGEAAQGNAFAEQSWREFHDFVEAARLSAEKATGFGLLVDLHGHSHALARLELGYHLGATELALSDEELDQPGYVLKSTLRSIARAHPDIPFSTLVRGPGSLGDLFNRAGFPAWPSPPFPSIGDAEFFRGGHIVRLHSGLQDDSRTAAVQIETPFRGVRDTPRSRAAFAVAFADVLTTYLKNIYGYALPVPPDGDGPGCDESCLPSARAPQPSTPPVAAPSSL
jgi:hypothetical protein